MIGKPINELQDIISFDTLQEIIQQVYAVTGMRTVIANYLGEIYEELQTGEEYDPCSEVRASGLMEMCDRSDAFAGLEAARQGKPLIYRCHCGAAEAVSPIIVNGQYFGSILTGQSLLPEEEMEGLIQFVPPVENMTSKQQKVCDELPSKLIRNTLERLHAVSQLLYIITNYIAEIGFNASIQNQVNEYVIQLQKEKLLNARLERDMVTTHLSNMQSQMHPHFFFNALNTINQTAILEGAIETPKLILTLSGILRRSVDFGKKPGQLRDEVEHIKSYLTIAKCSLEDRLTVQCEVDDSCLDVAIPAFTLLPFVENAVKHGLENKVEGGLLVLSIQKLDDMLHIDINDNGNGMDSETLRKILSHKSTDYLPNTNSSTGIYNSIQILSHFFGEAFSWTCESKPGLGTRFHLRIPYQTDDSQIKPGI